MQPKPLTRQFYRPNALHVGPRLLGKLLCHRTPQGLLAARIVEVEAYCGEKDLASHARAGLTPRTRAMYGPPGHAYMFLLYGMHWAFNVVVGPVGTPHAVLVRAVEPIVGADAMAARRGMTPGARSISNGPGKLCAAMGLDGAHYGADLCNAELFVAASPRRGAVAVSPRINVDYAGPWASKPWRFFLSGHRCVSVPPRR